MRTLAFSWLAATQLVVMAAPASATVVTLDAGADTFITQHAGLGGPNSTHGSDAALRAIQGSGSFITRPLLIFDLSAHAGSSAGGPATIELFVQSFHPSAPPGATNTIDLRLVTSPWTAETVTWNTQPTVGGTVDTNVIINPDDVGTWQSWTIDEAVIQSWIDSPDANFGVMLVSTTGTNERDVSFDSLEGTSDQAPRLTFDLTAPCPWDCDGSDDGNVNVTDLLALLGQFDIQAPVTCDGGSCDYGGNGCVDVTDLLKLLAHYTTDPQGLGCPQ